MGGHHDHPVPGSNGSIKVDVSIEELIRSAPRRSEAARARAPREPFQLKYTVGLDVGSTTVKAVVVEAESDAILWQDYQRHETKQPEKVLEFLNRMESEIGIAPNNCRIFVTGSGGGSLAPLLGAKFVQEGTAVSPALEKLHPRVNSVVEFPDPN